MAAIHSWGANSYGQLGQGHTDDVLVPREVRQCLQPGSITGGGGHTVLLAENDQCYSCGNNNRGQTGCGTTHADVRSFLPISDHVSHVQKVVGGWDFSLAITVNGSLYSWGSNSFGQLGCPGVSGSSNVPVAPPVTDVTVLDIAAGLRHSVILLDNGEVFTAGAARKGQLGITETDMKHGAKFYTTFQQVKLPASCGRPVQVTAGAYHTAILTDRGQVVVCGDNKHGQIALDPSEIRQQNEPVVISQHHFSDKKITKICSGWSHMLGLTDDGHVFSWGRSDYGQLGRPPSQTYSPTRVEVPPPTQLVCGAEHNLLLTSDGDVYSWGWNEHGMCGTGDDVNVLYPRVVKSLKGHRVVNIGCGAGHCLVIIDNR